MKTRLIVLALLFLLAAPDQAQARDASSVVMGDNAFDSDCPTPPTPTITPTYTHSDTPTETPAPSALPTVLPLLEDLAKLGFEAVWESPGVLLITLSDEKTHFDVAQDTLKEEGILRLSVLAGVLIKYPGNHLQIDGHTDSRGNKAFNFKLSRRRADRVKNTLVDKGVLADSFDRVEGWGPDKPLVSNDSEADRAKNRRVEVRIRFHQLMVTPTETLSLPPEAAGSPTVTPEMGTEMPSPSATATPAAEAFSATPSPIFEAQASATPTAPAEAQSQASPTPGGDIPAQTVPESPEIELPKP